MNEMAIFAARTQAKITMILILGLFVLVILFLGAAFLGGCSPTLQDKLITIAGTVVTQVLPIAGLAAGYWFARHRPNSGIDPSPLPTSTENPK